MFEIPDWTGSLDHHLTIPIRGKLTQKDVFQTLVGMACMHKSIHSITQTLSNVACETSLRYHLKKLSMEDLERASAAILAHSLSSVLVPGESYQFAIDYTHDPYYGDTSSVNENYVIRSKRKKSTNDFYSYVTLYAIIKDRQVTLAVYPHRHGISKVGYIALCLDRISELGFTIEALCLDREFYTRRVIEFLQNCAGPVHHAGEKAWSADERSSCRQQITIRYLHYEGETVTPINNCYRREIPERKTWETRGCEPRVCRERNLLEPVSCPSGLSIPVLYRIVISDAKPGETTNDLQRSGTPISLCHYLVSLEEYLGVLAVDQVLSNKAGAKDHLYALLQV